MGLDLRRQHPVPGALLLIAFDRRILWVLGAALQVLVFLGYLSVSPNRAPPFDAWGIVLRIIQVPLFLALLYLAVRPAELRAGDRTAPPPSTEARGAVPGGL